MIYALKISFEGSFQCRLATDDDPTDASPPDPYGTYGPAALGWTYCYNEPPFDRIIRLSAPVALRNARLDPWRDVTVTGLETCQVPMPPGILAPVLVDHLLGEPVSFGNAKFDTAAGGGSVTHEALIDFKLKLGASLSADASPRPKLRGVTRSEAAWKTAYTLNKPGLVAAAAMNPVRKSVLTEPGRIDSLASFYQLYDPCLTVALTAVHVGAPVGVLGQLGPVADYRWTMEAAFFKFDGDTLTGLCEGSVSAVHR